MKNSRSQGILYFETKKPYQVSIAGGFEDRTEVICHDVNSKCESAALDLEQLLISAMASLKGNGTQQDQDKIDEDKKKSEDFFSNESPNHDEIADQAKGLEMAFMMNSDVKISEVIKAFKEMVAAGVISTTGDIPMTMPVWDKIGIKDKSYICFMYCAFFANPLERL